MREPIAVEVATYDLKKSEQQINAAVEAFSNYVLQIRRTQNLRSKYGLLGPAGKALTELKAGRYDRDSLIGFTLRTQESGRSGQFLPEIQMQTLNSLEQAVDNILAILKDAPEPYHAAILDRLDYGIFYRLRRSQLEGKEAVRQNWIRFVEEKYGSADAVTKAWGREVSALSSLILPTKQARKEGRRSSAEQADISAFYAPLSAPTIREDED